MEFGEVYTVSESKDIFIKFKLLKADPSTSYIAQKRLKDCWRSLSGSNRDNTTLVRRHLDILGRKERQS